MKPNCPAVDSCRSLDKARLHSTQGAAPCHVQKQRSPDGPLAVPMSQWLWHRQVPRTCPKQSQELSPGMVTVDVLLQLPDCTSSWSGEATGNGILNTLRIPRDLHGMQRIRAGYPS